MNEDHQPKHCVHSNIIFINIEGMQYPFYLPNSVGRGNMKKVGVKCTANIVNVIKLLINYFEVSPL